MACRVLPRPQPQSTPQGWTASQDLSPRISVELTDALVVALVDSIPRGVVAMFLERDVQQLRVLCSGVCILWPMCISLTKAERCCMMLHCTVIVESGSTLPFCPLYILLNMLLVMFGELKDVDSHWEYISAWMSFDQFMSTNLQKRERNHSGMWWHQRRMQLWVKMKAFLFRIRQMVDWKCRWVTSREDDVSESQCAGGCWGEAGLAETGEQRHRSSWEMKAEIIRFPVQFYLFWSFSCNKCHKKARWCNVPAVSLRCLSYVVKTTRRQSSFFHTSRYLWETAETLRPARTTYRTRFSEVWHWCVSHSSDTTDTEHLCCNCKGCAWMQIRYFSMICVVSLKDPDHKQLLVAF